MVGHFGPALVEGSAELVFVGVFRRDRFYKGPRNNGKYRFQGIKIFCLMHIFECSPLLAIILLDSATKLSPAITNHQSMVEIQKLSS